MIFTFSDLHVWWRFPEGACVVRTWAEGQATNSRYPQVTYASQRLYGSHGQSFSRPQAISCQSQIPNTAMEQRVLADLSVVPSQTPDLRQGISTPDLPPSHLHITIFPEQRKWWESL